jgi:DNA-directed RNA polymerase specialized sigma24 family protein
LALWQEVDRLPEKQRAAVYLRYRADLDFAGVAFVLGITESGARANVFRALARLRERMIDDE